MFEAVGALLHLGEGQAVTNFKFRLPAPGAEKAQQTLKELGAGFAFVGKRVSLEVGGDDFFIDLLFHHLKLRCYVVIEPKARPFKPEPAGHLPFDSVSVRHRLARREGREHLLGLRENVTDVGNRLPLRHWVAHRFAWKHHRWAAELATPGCGEHDADRKHRCVSCADGLHEDLPGLQREIR